MVDQAQVTPTNGRTELPPQAVARGTAEFLHDVATLAELQGKLVVIDLRGGLAQMLPPVVALGVGAAVGLGSVPVGLAALALTLAANTKLSLPACWGISLVVGVVLCAVLVIPAWIALQKSVRIFERSLAEWRRNMQWIKDMLKRIGQSPAPRSSPHGL